MLSPTAILRRVHTWYLAGNRWWLPLLAGLLFLFALPPFNHTSHWLLAPFPLISFLVVVPLLAFAAQPSPSRAFWHCQLFGMTAAASQYYWIVFDTAEGVWHLIILGVVLLCAFFGLYYLALGMLFRLCRRLLPRAYLVVFPAAWVILEYLRTLGDLSFPWMLIGYAWTPLGPLAQLASIGGVYLLSFMVVTANVLCWRTCAEAVHGQPTRVTRRLLIGGTVVLALALVWGSARLARPSPASPSATFACVQPNLDHLRPGEHSLDTAFAEAEALAYQSAAQKPDCILMPESALLCYLMRRPEYASRVVRWRDSTHAPFLIGTLHWEPASRGSIYKYMVYNTGAFLDTGTTQFKLYYKMRLVPFSEELPFEGVFPALSRVNLGEADFKRGREPTVFRFGNGIAAVPLICYEVIYPGFVRSRLSQGANVIANITNDGWFGHTPGAFHHAAMAQLRCIENGVSMVRCANTGISMLVDQYGRVLARTGIYVRTTLVGRVSLARIPTLYTRLGDWVVWVCCFIVAAGARTYVVRHMRPRGPSTRPR